MAKEIHIHDEIYGQMLIDPLLLNFIDTPEFQRLRFIKQLGASCFVFPSATHTRFEHSIGVAHLTGIMIKSICSKQPELGITDRHVILLQLAGLLHDIGHLCYSHFFDGFFLKNKLGDVPEREHEYRSNQIIDLIVSKYDIPITKEEIEFVKHVIEPTDEDIGFMFEIVANKKHGIDTDKLDYMQRDCYNIGISCPVDVNRIVSHARVIENHICFPFKTRSSIYKVFTSRYELYRDYYTHHAIQEIEMMLADMLEDIDDEGYITAKMASPEEYCSLTDNIIDNYIEHPLYRRILEKRNLYKTVLEVINPDMDLTKELLQELDEDLDMSKIRIKNFEIGFSRDVYNPVILVPFYSRKASARYLKPDEIELLSGTTSANIRVRICRVFCTDEDYIDKLKIVCEEAKKIIKD